MDYLARREHTRSELQAKLEKAGFDADTARETIDTLAGEGLQSDERFAEAYVQSRINQGKGPVRIRAELRERRLSDSAIEAGLEAVQQDWIALARAARNKKFGAELPQAFADRAKQMRFLQYRGFESEQIRAAVSTSDESA